MSTTNKTQLQTNNAKLDTLTSLAQTMKDKAAALPDAGSGGSVETCTVEISSSAQITSTIYQPNLGEFVTWAAEEPLDYPAPFQCVCGSLLYVVSTNSNMSIEGIESAGRTYLYIITASAGETAKVY